MVRWDAVHGVESTAGGAWTIGAVVDVGLVVGATAGRVVGELRGGGLLAAAEPQAASMPMAGRIQSSRRLFTGQ